MTIDPTECRKRRHFQYCIASVTARSIHASSSLVCDYAGWIFLFVRKRLVGSHFAFTLISRS
jgi:hypothetical protein